MSSFANGHPYDLTVLIRPVTADHGPLTAEMLQSTCFYGGLPSSVCGLVAET